MLFQIFISEHLALRSATPRNFFHVSFDAESCSDLYTLLLTLPKSPNTTSYTLLATSNPNTTPNNPSTSTTSPAKYSDFTAILLTLVRLVDQKTDIAISINVPHLHGDYDVSVIDMQAGRYGGLIERAMRYREEILRTFEVMEWGLFVDG